ncbi:enoyl-CoA hydratase-related protein [Embleya sp. NPDC050154]|uniref:enoyl-CoA hydratase-related protein n=1 Tax=Embleya sp. NPDC050154 TaxID=3363988 RepID=UPI0037AA937A
MIEIAVVAATTALWFALTVKGPAAIAAGASLLTGVAVSEMHYTDMFAMNVRVRRRMASTNVRIRRSDKWNGNAVRRILLLASGNNGLTQRADLALRAAGHQVRLAVVADGSDILRAVAPADFEVVICPFLKTRIPSSVWKTWPTVVIHPGPVGDRGPSSLDWAIADGEPLWGVTALSAVEEMDAGPIWATRTFPMSEPPARKSAVYNGPVADAAVECVLEVAEKAADPAFLPVPAQQYPKAVPSARLRPAMSQTDRAFRWDSPGPDIVRSIAAADGFPGVLANIGSRAAYLYDARLDGPVAGALPGTIVARHHEAVRVAARDSSVWIGHMRAKTEPTARACKLPAVQTLARGDYGVDIAALPEATCSPYTDIRYRREGDIGYLTFDFYNGAMSTRQCGRLLSALREATTQDTKVLVLRGGPEFFSNGIHLNVIEAADQPAMEAWLNITAINAVCRTILTTTEQVLIAAFEANAGAGGVMLPLGADVVVARPGIVLNPHYATMGLSGSELHTYTLPRRVGDATARRLTTECRPIDAETALAIGLLDRIGPARKTDFDRWLADLARAEVATHEQTLDSKRKTLAADGAFKPVAAYETEELEAMAFDMFANRQGFAHKRHRFVFKL